MRFTPNSLHTRMATRTAFFVSDRTGITAEMLGHSLLTQFDRVEFTEITLPFVDSPEKAEDAVAQIDQTAEKDGARPLVFSTLVDQAIAQCRPRQTPFTRLLPGVHPADGRGTGGPVFAHRGQVTQCGRSNEYFSRIEAVNFALAHDDGQSTKDLAQRRRDPGGRVALWQDADLPLPGAAVRHSRGQLSADSGGLRRQGTAGGDSRLPQQAVRPDHPARPPATHPQRTPSGQRLRQSCRTASMNCARPRR